jgi:uncharacterized protein (DUF2252 family)
MATNKKKTNKNQSIIPQTAEPVFRSREERLSAGKALRAAVPRESHAVWKPPAESRDPVEVLEQSNQSRVSALVPIRYGRMLRSPFTFLRGSAGLMAYDLSSTPVTGMRVQACGDCHLLNFGLFATPERNLVFDINDFDETLPAPWEWDVKRLAASFTVAGRDNQLSDVDAKDAAIECGRSYREHLRAYSKMNPLEVWYDRLDVDKLVELAPDAKAKKLRQDAATKARQRIGEHLFPKITAQVGGQPRLVDQPPILFHVDEPQQEELLQEALQAYRASLSDERRMLFDRYRLVDFAVKVVGIGSVGTRCFIGLFFSPENHPLLLQFKEAAGSVLEPYAGASAYSNHGQRVVMGQRLMQSSSDIFLGWTRSRYGYDFFGRQLRDMKFSPPAEGVTAKMLKRYADICGWTLARAHAKSGDAATISGYLGKSAVFEQALGEFAIDYANQTERDYAALAEAERSGRIQALIEENL